MSKTYKCHHCHGRYPKNPRLKGNQSYCNSKECQQERKNVWEREKLKNDTNYKSKRQAAKRKWYYNYSGDKYQSEYRKSHPKYCENNREKQVLRNQKRQILTTQPKIVKTDTLSPESTGLQGLYVLLPYKKAVEKTDAKKIVKTDTLIVQILAASEFRGDFLSDSS